tara:strand:+ start:1886 stop:2788 length:903 start_codon:yes stop_codon:yes gene_type:complete
MIELILFREAFFYVAYAGMQCVLTYAVHLFVPDTSMSLARLACTVQFAWFVALLMLMFLAAGILGIDVDSIEAVDPDSEEPAEPAEKKAENEASVAGCDGVLLATTAVTAGIFIALLAGTVVCMHAAGAAVCAATSGGQYALGVMCVLLVMQAQLLFSSAITSNIQRRDRTVPPVLVLGVLVCAYATGQVVLVLPSINGGGQWLESGTVFLWLAYYCVQIVYVMLGFLRSVFYSMHEALLQRLVFVWLQALMFLLVLPALFLFTLFDATSGGLLFTPLVTVTGLYVRFLVLHYEPALKKD